MPYVHPAAQQNENEKMGRKKAESEKIQHCKEKNMADQWMDTKKSFSLKKTKMFVARPEGRDLEEVNQSINRDICSGLERQRHALARWVSMQDSQQCTVVNQLNTKYTASSSKTRKPLLGTLEEVLP